MKKFLFFGILLLALSPFILSLEINSEESYSIGETALIKVSGNFISPILEKNVLIYRGGAKTASLLNVENIEDEYYISVSLVDKTSGNYSVKIVGASYLDGRNLITEDIIIPFKIDNKTIDFSIFPGAIRTSNNFSVSVQNLRNSKIRIALSGSDLGTLSSESNYYDLKSGETKEIEFYSKNIEETKLKNILFSSGNYSYYLPVYLEKSEESKEEEKVEYSFNPAYLKINSTIGTKKTYFAYLENTGEKDLENVSLSVSEDISDYISILINESFSLEKNSSLKVEIYLNSPKDEKTISGKIRAIDDLENYAYLYIELNTAKDYIPINETNQNYSNELEEDINTNSNSSTSKIVGWVIILILLLIVGWFFFKKYKRTGNQKIDLLKIARGKEKA